MVRATTDVQDVQLAFMAAGNGIKALNPRELALKRTIIVEGPPLHDLYRPEKTERIARQR